MPNDAYTDALKRKREARAALPAGQGYVSDKLMRERVQIVATTSGVPHYVEQAQTRGAWTMWVGKEKTPGRVSIKIGFPVFRATTRREFVEKTNAYWKGIALGAGGRGGPNRAIASQEAFVKRAEKGEAKAKGRATWVWPTAGKSAEYTTQLQSHREEERKATTPAQQKAARTRTAKFANRWWIGHWRGQGLTPTEAKARVAEQPRV